MALDQAANFVRGSLTAAVGPADTTFEVANASQYPDPSTRQYNLVVWDADNHARPDQDGNVEIVRVSARDTTADELTVARGEENTSAASHPNGAAVQLSPTAKVVEDVNTRTSALSDDGTTADLETVHTGVLGHDLEDNNDETGNRSLNTEYQNTNDYSLFVTVTLQYDDTEQINNGLEVGNSSGLAVEDRIDINRADGGANGYQRVTCQGIVPPGGYYSMQTYGDDAGSLYSWFERGYR